RHSSAIPIRPKDEGHGLVISSSHQSQRTPFRSQLLVKLGLCHPSIVGSWVLARANAESCCGAVAIGLTVIRCFGAAIAAEVMPNAITKAIATLVNIV